MSWHQRDTLSIDTHRSHVYTISVRYTVELDPWIPPHLSVIFKSLALAPSQATTIVSTCGFSI